MDEPKENEVILSVIKVLGETLKHLEKATRYVKELHDGYKEGLDDAGTDKQNEVRNVQGFNTVWDEIERNNQKES